MWTATATVAGRRRGPGEGSAAFTLRFRTSVKCERGALRCASLRRASSMSASRSAPKTKKLKKRHPPSYRFASHIACVQIAGSVERATPQLEPAAYLVMPFASVTYLIAILASFVCLLALARLYCRLPCSELTKAMKSARDSPHSQHFSRDTHFAL